MPETSTWFVRGRMYTAGAASTRLYRDLVRQRGEQEAEAIREDATAVMPRVRALNPDSPGLRTFDVVCEALLLAAGVPEGEVPALARRYRSRSSASLDLSQYFGSSA